MCVKLEMVFRECVIASFVFGAVCLNTIFFSNFLAKSVVVSIIFGTFVFELERTGKNGRDDDSNE